MEKKKICGVMGGMGPMATVDFMTKVIESTKATKDSDHMHMVVDCNTSVPDRTSYILGEGESPLAALVETVHRLEQAGADFLVLTCNTAHSLYEVLNGISSVPILNIMEECGKRLQAEDIHTVGVLATTGTLAAQNYERFMESYGINIVVPEGNDQKEVMSFIYDKIKNTEVDLKNCSIEPLLKVIRHLKEQGAEAVILGCTELPIVLNSENVGMKCLDATKVLAEAAIIYGGYEVK